ncbi:hypothetical protein FD06_GL000960 [Apilactobacillus ozensis DSM 23829 = JCM 17196]|uniref:CSD domain-containing protein n=1 Tax=Apilactobacillus ozensis DSM 23829 = JCM 17196 TaxID=1423781 RepID=A0A0R2AQD1_9LACO|nr:cold shock domain-containing protein [Apilactobacillus ozensis]KRM68642.1 hypothetical protein FD06_GL000960 [Apilactobacillus ozensis DSM 23829 = JCM 17196]
MINGKIDNFNAEHDFGFLKDDDKNKVFFHASAVINKRSKDIAIGQKATYQVAEGKKGLQAVKITILE